MPKTYEEKKAEFLADESTANLHNGSTDESMWKVSWGHVDLEIWKIWRDFSARGEGVKVAVIDTGASISGNDLSGRISGSSLSVIGDSTDDVNPIHHGTMSAGLIGADGQTAKTVIGVATACELLIVKAGNQGFYPSDIEKALQRARDLGAKIVSMSIEDYRSPVSSMENLVQTCSTAGMILVAAAGDLGDASISYPASYPGCFSVGAYSLDQSNRRVLWEGSNKNQFVKFLAPGDNLHTCSPSATAASYGGTSAATAFAAGIMALVLSAKGNGSAEYAKVLTALQNGACTEGIGNDSLPSDNQGYGVIAPLTLMTAITRNAG